MIIPEKITIKVHYSNVKHYRDLGIECESGQEVEVLTTQLTKSSREMVTRKCDECGDELTQRRLKVNDICKKCATAKANSARKDESLRLCACGNTKGYGAKTCKECYNKLDKSGENSASWGVKNPHKSDLANRQQGETHWNWQGGKSKRSGKQIAWAKEVKELSGQVCDCCGYERVIALEAHHLYSDNTDRGEFTMKNGVSLCSNCHKEFHRSYGYGDNTEEQYIEFKESYNE